MRGESPLVEVAEIPISPDGTDVQPPLDVPDGVCSVNRHLCSVWFADQMGEGLFLKPPRQTKTYRAQSRNKASPYVMFE